MPAGMQRVEIGDAIDAEHDGLAVDDEAGLPHLARRLHDPRITVGKVVAAPRIRRTPLPSRSSLSR